MIFRLFLVCLCFNFVFINFSFFVSKSWCLSKGARRRLERLLFNLLDCGMVDWSVIQAKILFKSYSLVIDFRGSECFCSGPVPWGDLWRIMRLSIGHNGLLLSNLFASVIILKLFHLIPIIFIWIGLFCKFTQIERKK